MIDVYFCTIDYARTDTKFAALRHAYAEACRCRWEMEPQVRLHVLYGENDSFQWERRVKADSLSRSEIYGCVDDDVLIVDRVLPLQHIMGAFEDHPDFAILSAIPMNCNIVPWTPEGYKAQIDSTVMEHVSVGGMRFCRKGTMKDLPKTTSKSYDGQQSEWLREKRMRVGYLRQVPMFHAGEYFSTVWG